MESLDDKSYFPQVNQPGLSSHIPPQPKGPPPLPPRSINSSASSLLEPPPSHGQGNTPYHSQPFDQSWLSQDPRSTSTQSLIPAERSNGKRTLLMIYLHGFLGSETSFGSFPAHVHNLVSVVVAKTHVVHTKIYPRYRSRRAIEHARDEFSNWLRPNETADTDIVLLGHSMGGILSAEVALLRSSPSRWPEPQQFRHKILGTISFDCPFLGMHPGIVISGIGSLFRPTPKSPGNQNPYLGAQDQVLGIYPSDSGRASSHSPDSLLLNHSGCDPGLSPGASLMTSENSHPSPSDPNYNPPFPNDIRLPERTGWDNALHFVTKHSHDLAQAVNSYLTSHLEFGGCLADYKGLKNRYTILRSLEDIKLERDHARRIRFLNYYTTCTGRPKTQKTVAVSGDAPFSCTTDARIPGKHCPEHDLQESQNLSLSALTAQSFILSPRISVEEYQDGEVHPKNAEDSEGVQPLPEENPATDGSIVMSADDSAQVSADQTGSGLITLEPSSELEPPAIISARPDESHSLPPLPSFPEGPQPYDPASYTDRMSRNLAHKKYTAQFKSYLRALKAYDKAVNHRLKLIEQNENADDKAKKLSKSQESKKALPLTQIVKLPKKPKPGPTSPLPIKASEASSTKTLSPKTENKTKKERRFCVLPPRINGQLDKCWVQVFMKDVDEVGAHCGLFVLGDHYGWLVNDVATKIQAWVEEM